MIELAQILTNKRKSLNLSIDDVANRTSVRKHYIEAIEAGEINELPAVYGLSFIKKYAKLVDVDINELLPELEKQLGTITKTYRTEQISYGNIKSTQNFNYQNLLDKDFYFAFFQNTNVNMLATYAAIFLVVIALLIWLFSSSPSQPELEISQSDLITTTDTTVLEAKESKGLLDYFSKQDSLVLDVVALEDCWVKISIDGKTNDEVLMKPEMRRRWAAKEYFIITQGNVGALQISRNGKLLEPFGARGSVSKDVKITADKVIGN